MLPANPMSISPHPRAAAHALQRTLQPVIAELLQSSFPAAAPRAAACLPVRQGPVLKRALMGRPSELHQSSFCKSDLPAEASARAASSAADGLAQAGGEGPRHNNRWACGASHADLTAVQAYNPSPRTRGRGRLRARQRLNVVQPVRRGRDVQEHHRPPLLGSSTVLPHPVEHDYRREKAECFGGECQHRFDFVCGDAARECLAHARTDRALALGAAGDPQAHQLNSLAVEPTLIPDGVEEVPRLTELRVPPDEIFLDLRGFGLALVRASM